MANAITIDLSQLSYEEYVGLWTAAKLAIDDDEKFMLAQWEIHRRVIVAWPWGPVTFDVWQNLGLVDTLRVVQTVNDAFAGGGSN